MFLASRENFHVSIIALVDGTHSVYNTQIMNSKAVYIYADHKNIIYLFSSPGSYL